MDKNILWVNEKKIERTIKALENNNMNGYLVSNKNELLDKIQDIINDGDLVSCGGSMSLFETGIIDFLKNGKYKFLDRYKNDMSPADLKEIFRKTFFADAYFTSTNAITENGELYNVDGNGNRIAAMLYGPNKVIVISGVNKIVKNLDEAINRNKEICAPANAKRIGSKTPCNSAGYCMDCSSPDRICCEYAVIKKQRVSDRLHVIFLNDSFGY
ncbi:MAG: lactate utilization protein [Romboutsia sp.]